MQKAKELFEAASELGYTEALVNLGILEECEFHRQEQAFSLYLKAAKLGNAKGMRKAAYAYCDGVGVVQNWDEGTRWMMMASSAGDPEAMGEIGGYYLYNTFISPEGLEMRDAGTGMLLLDQAIWDGSASAHYYWSGVFSGKYDITGSAYEEIMDIPSEENAFSQMLMSAEMGYSQAMIEVADMYAQRSIWSKLLIGGNALQICTEPAPMITDAAKKDRFCLSPAEPIHIGVNNPFYANACFLRHWCKCRCFLNVTPAVPFCDPEGSKRESFRRCYR